MSGQSSPAVITMELFDDKAPLTVANFLRYVNNLDASGDYDGTFFHRLIPGFVLQGGGSNATDNTHIPVFDPVHNEYDPDDLERSNLRGTISMAKVGPDQGGGAHSATSEFFISLADNSENLNNQNGGFTVFGRITDTSMEVVDAIAALQRVGDNGNGGVPVQNYPGSGNPTPDQKIQIVDARVILPTEADTNFTYEYTFTDGSGQLSKLVTGKLNADNDLALKFAPGKAGVVTVTVKALLNGVEQATDEFFVTLKPNLIAGIADDGLATTFIPGDKGTAKVELTNNAGGHAKGTVKVQLYLSKAAPTSANNDLKGFTLDLEGEDQDILIEEQDVRVNLASGKSAVASVKYTIPAHVEDKLADGSSYRLIAKVVSDTDMQELHTDDNVGVHKLDTAPSLTDAQIMPAYDLAFGNVGGRKNIPLTLDVNGESMTFTLTGGGTGTLTEDANGNFSLSVTGTTASSVLSVKLPKGETGLLHGVLISDTIGKVQLGSVNLLGHFTAAGGAKSIIFGNLGDNDPLTPLEDFDFSVNAFPVPTQKLAVTFGEVRDFSFLSNMPVGTLTAKLWLDEKTISRQIFAPSLGTLKITGDLEANVLLTEESKVALFSVGGELRNSTVRTFGDIATVKLGGLVSSEFFAGITSAPDDIGDFTAGRTISSFTVTGEVSDSVVAAGKFNAITVGSVDTAAGASTKGFYADAIKSYVRKTPTAARFTNLDFAQTVDASQNYEVQVF
jgi:cyclophilin family peptidyl-prolyl cis-trans isomerase